MAAASISIISRGDRTILRARPSVKGSFLHPDRLVPEAALFRLSVIDKMSTRCGFFSQIVT